MGKSVGEYFPAGGGGNTLKGEVITVAFENFDHILHMQIRIANLYRSVHNMSISDFMQLDRMTDFLSFIADAYESFHLTGDIGILEEIDDFVRVSTGVNHI